MLFICRSNRPAAVRMPRAPVLKQSSSVQTTWAVHSRKLISRSNSSSYPFEKKHQPCERLKLFIRKKTSAIRTLQAVRSKKIISCSNGSSYPLEKFITCSNGSSYPFKQETSVFGSCSNKTRKDLILRTCCYLQSPLPTIAEFIIWRLENKGKISLLILLG